MKKAIRGKFDGLAHLITELRFLLNAFFYKNNFTAKVEERTFSFVGFYLIIGRREHTL